MEARYRSTLWACCFANFFQAVGSCFAILYVPLRGLYGLSFTDFGFLVSLNFITQVASDVLFSKPVEKYGFRPFAVAAPLVSAAGLGLFAAAPLLFPRRPFAGFCAGMFLFAAAGGLQELLLSPILDALPIPEERKARSMSMLHSFFAWGQIFVVLATTGLLAVWGAARWQWIVLLWAAPPVAGAVLFCRVPLARKNGGAPPLPLRALARKGVFYALLAAIVLGGAAEVTMAQWASAFLEKGLRLPKLAGDVWGVCFFSLMLALGRSGYAALGARVPLRLSFLPLDCTDSVRRWVSSNPAVLSVDERGVISAVGEGSAYLSAISAGGLSCGMEVQVEPAPSGIQLEPSRAQLERGEELQMQLMLLEADGSAKPNTGHLTAWSSSDARVATVDSQGRVTALRSGSCVITAAADGLTASCALNVSVGVQEIALNLSEARMYPDQALRPIQLEWAVYPADADDPSLIFESDNEAVAVVSPQGEVRMTGQVGAAAISVRSASGAQATFTVNVIERPRATATPIPQTTQPPAPSATPLMGAQNPESVQVEQMPANAPGAANAQDPSSAAGEQSAQDPSSAAGGQSAQSAAGAPQPTAVG